MQSMLVNGIRRRLSLALLAALAVLTLLIPLAPTRAATPGTEQAKLTASDGQADDEFGISVAIDGDTAIVGAYCSPGGNCAGAAYVYVRSAGVWTEQTKLVGSDTASGDQFGISVAFDGNTAVVGADQANNSGSAYVFVRTGTTWSQQAKLTAGDGAASDGFGRERAVAISVDTVVVGAFSDDDAGNQSGSAYVFFRTGTSWSEQAKLTAGDGSANDQFGWSTAIDGDTVVIGARRAENVGVVTGAAYVFVRTGGTTWNQQAKLLASDGVVGDEFGYTVGVSGETAMMSAPFDDDVAANSGSAYIFLRTGGTS
jgi:hypothetical protein